MLSRLKSVIALMRDPRVSKLPKALVVGAIVYLLMPVDAIPDVAPVVGWLDDIGFLIGAVTLLLRAAPKRGTASPGDQVIDVTPEPPVEKPRP